MWGMPLLVVLQRLRKLVLIDNHLTNLHQVSLKARCHVLMHAEGGGDGVPDRAGDTKVSRAPAQWCLYH